MTHYDDAIARVRYNMRLYRRAYVGTQKDLMSKSGIHFNRISNYETGVLTPNLKTICKLAEIFGVTVTDMFK